MAYNKKFKASPKSGIDSQPKEGDHPVAFFLFYILKLNEINTVAIGLFFIFAKFFYI